MKPNQIEGEWEKDFESLWGASFDSEGDIEPFEFERLKDFVRQILETTRKEAYEKGLHETAIRADKEMVDWLKDNSEGIEMIEDIKKEAIKSTLTSVMEEAKNLKPEDCYECSGGFLMQEEILALIQKHISEL